ncbi:MAG: copper chaperone PCu(A)C [Gemmatimonadota bacterium]
MRRLTFLAALLASACGGRAPAPAPIEVRAPWARPADSAAVTAAYLTLFNHEALAVTLSSASSPLAESVTLHETMQMSGMVHMMPLDSGQVIAPGDSLVLAEGAKHLMVMGLKRTLTGGDSLPLELRFSDGRVLHATAAVRAP